MACGAFIAIDYFVFNHGGDYGFRPVVLDIEIVCDIRAAARLERWEGVIYGDVSQEWDACTIIAIPADSAHIVYIFSDEISSFCGCDSGVIQHMHGGDGGHEGGGIRRAIDDGDWAAIGAFNHYA